MEEIEQPVAVGDDTPILADQASAKGWRFGFFNFGKAERKEVEYFNPGLVRRPDGLWLLVRRSEIVTGMWYGRNHIWACKLDDNKQPLGGPTLKFLDSGPEEQFEDPRAVYWNSQTWVGCVNFTWYTDGTWTGAHQMLGVFSDKGGNEITQASWTPLARRDPIVGTNQGHSGDVNGQHNKNLLWWFIDDKLYCLYKSDPWEVVEFGSNWHDQKHHGSDGVRWNYGVVRGGTPPVRVGDYFWTFFHSSLPWRGRYRRYYMGCVAFNAHPPYAPAKWTMEPLLIGNQNDPWHQKKPLVVFPCGAVFENEKWLISMGVNDLKSAWIEIPHVHLETLLFQAPVLPGLSLLAEQTKLPESTHVEYVEEERGDVECYESVQSAEGSESIVSGANVASSAAPTSKPEGAAPKIDKRRGPEAKARAAHAREMAAKKRAAKSGGTK